MTTLCLEDVKSSVPAVLKRAVTQDFVDTLNKFGSDPDFFDAYMGNLTTFHSVLNSGKFKMTDYFKAVQYVSYKLMGRTNFDAYKETFPDRYAQHVANGITPNQVSSYVSMYNKNTLVTAILQQAMIPIHISHNHIFLESIKVQVEIMSNTSVSPKTRSDAAAHLSTLLAPPKESKVQVDVSIGTTNSLESLQNSIDNLVNMQLKAISDSSTTALDVAGAKLIESSAEELS